MKRVRFMDIAKKERNVKYFGLFPYVHFTWDSKFSLMYWGWLKWALIFTLIDRS